MYSYEERIRAVKLYIKLGGRLGATLRKLGYPTKNTLISWYREYERDSGRWDTPVGTYSPSGSMNCIHSCAVVWWVAHPIPNIPRK